MSEYEDMEREREMENLQSELRKAISESTGIPLDDLLPQNDATYEPPDNLGDLFERGGAFWEGICDRWKWPERNKDFTFGYQAALFDVALRIGKSFAMPISKGRDEWFINRASQYGRRCERSDGSTQLNLVVYARETT